MGDHSIEISYYRDHKVLMALLFVRVGMVLAFSLVDRNDIFNLTSFCQHVSLLTGKHENIARRYDCLLPRVIRSLSFAMRLRIVYEPLSGLPLL